MNKKLIILVSFLAFTSFWCLAPKTGATVTVSSTAELENAVAKANAGGDKTIAILDGTYTLSDMLWIDVSGVTIKSYSGNRENVILQGNGMTGDVSHIFKVNGDNFRTQDMTLKRVANHAIQLQIDIDNVVLKNLHILDTGEQMIKVAYDASQRDKSLALKKMAPCLF